MRIVKVKNPDSMMEHLRQCDQNHVKRMIARGGEIPEEVSFFKDFLWFIGFLQFGRPAKFAQKGLNKLA